MKISYDYEELINELKEEMLDESDDYVIQILRADKPLSNGYRPIIDWYYNHKTMIEMTSINVVYDNISIGETKKRMKSAYEKDRDKLEQITISECLSEMESMNSIF